MKKIAALALSVVLLASSLASCAFTDVVTGKNEQQQNALSAIEESFSELNDNRSSFGYDEWEMRIASFSASVDNYERSFPKDTENIEKIKGYLNTLNELEPLTEQDKRNRHLIDTARSEIIDLLGVSLEPHEDNGNILMHLRLENRSEYIINEVRMAFEAFDGFGEPSNGSGQGDNLWHVRSNAPLRPNVEESIHFQTAWGDTNISHIKILWMEVEYGPNFSVYLPPAVCEALWR
jgi:hypothetical protein